MYIEQYSHKCRTSPNLVEKTLTDNCDILDCDGAWHLEGPRLQPHPGQAPDLLFARLTALRFRMALAIGAELASADRLLLGHEARMHREDLFAVVLGVEMIGRMRGQGLAVVVDRHVDLPPEGLLRTPRWCRRRQNCRTEVHRRGRE